MSPADIDRGLAAIATLCWAAQTPQTIDIALDGYDDMAGALPVEDLDCGCDQA